MVISVVYPLTGAFLSFLILRMYVESDESAEADKKNLKNILLRFFYYLLLFLNLTYLFLF